MLGLPLDSWLLIGASVGLGLMVEFLFLRNQSRRSRYLERQAQDGSREQGAKP